MVNSCYFLIDCRYESFTVAFERVKGTVAESLMSRVNCPKF